MGKPTDGEHALVWSGTADSVVDLQSFLSPDYYDSNARDVDVNGNVIGYARYKTGEEHAILWLLVPEPSSVSLLALALGALCAYRLKTLL
jgi:hypothetical protein